MGMSMGVELTQTQNIRQEQSLSQKLEQKIQSTIIEPIGICPNCNRKLTEDEIRDGWTTNPIDFTTQCPDCKTRFEASLLLTLKGKNVGTHTYLCEAQLFAELKKNPERKIQNFRQSIFSQRKTSSPLELNPPLWEIRKWTCSLQA